MSKEMLIIVNPKSGKAKMRTELLDISEIFSFKIKIRGLYWRFFASKRLKFSTFSINLLSRSLSKLITERYLICRSGDN